MEGRAAGAGAVQGEVDAGFVEAFADDFIFEIAEGEFFAGDGDFVPAEEFGAAEGGAIPGSLGGVIGEDFGEDIGVIRIEVERENFIGRASCEVCACDGGGNGEESGPVVSVGMPGLVVHSGGGDVFLEELIVLGLPGVGDWGEGDSEEGDSDGE